MDVVSELKDGTKRVWKISQIQVLSAGPPSGQAKEL
jgi:hypothetical protein